MSNAEIYIISRTRKFYLQSFIQEDKQRKNLNIHTKNLKGKKSLTVELLNKMKWKKDMRIEIHGALKRLKLMNKMTKE